MKKFNVWIILAVVVIVLCAGVITLYGYLLLVGRNYYSTAEDDIEAEEISSGSVEIDTNLTSTFKEFGLDGFAVSYANGGVVDADMLNDGGVGESATALAEDSNAYIIADSDKRELTVSDLENLTPQELTYARNEIYARHGRKFDSTELQQYFDSKDWYVMDERFDDKDLNGIESENAHFISEYQEKNGKTYKAN